MSNQQPTDLTDTSFWNNAWEGRGLPESINPHSGRSRDLFYEVIHRKLRVAFGGLDAPRSQLLEVGCGSSAWMPYFIKEMGFQTWGIDYSEVGCAQTRAMLAREGVEGRVVEADFFAPPAEVLGRFDVVFSFGVVEHFLPPERCVTALAAMLKPGGLMVSVVPNLRGAPGAVQASINRPVFDIHVLHTDESLGEAHRLAGLDVLESGYFFGVNFGWIMEAGAPRTPTLRPKLRALSALRWGSRLSWWIERQGVLLPPSKLLSPAILCIAKKPV
jgi:SAM-dependent methyltransferase